MIRAIAIVGPTAVGKTAVAIELAKLLGSEIICCDSMQIYKYMDIGTAKPTPEERAEVPHRMTDFLSPLEKYSAADYAADALACAKEIHEKGKIPVFCGGTGLYLEAVRSGRHTDTDYQDPEYASELKKIAASENGAEALYKMLLECDPESAGAIHPNNVRRVIRALEITHAAGKPKSELDRLSREKSPDIELITFLIRPDDRELLYERINLRVDMMLKAGLIEEAMRLKSLGYLDGSTTASQAIGYKELLAYFNGDCTLAEAINSLKTATRRYAKRQLTWFRAIPGVNEISADENGKMRSPKEIADEILSEIKNTYNCEENR